MLSDGAAKHSQIALNFDNILPTKLWDTLNYIAWLISQLILMTVWIMHQQPMRRYVLSEGQL